MCIIDFNTLPPLSATIYKLKIYQYTIHRLDSYWEGLSENANRKFTLDLNFWLLSPKAGRIRGSLDTIATS